MSSENLNQEFEQDSGEIFLGDEQGWKEEAKGVIQDIDKFVESIFISEKLQSSGSEIYLNLTTLEKNHYTVELQAQGFRIVALAHDAMFDPDFLSKQNFYETPYSLLESISPEYIQAFGRALAEKLSLL